MKVLVYMILGIIIPCTAESKCSTLLMCPSFCMKIKHGCYVCDCGMFSNYLHRAAERMAANSNRQQSQTGTQLSSYTSGYNDVDSNRGVPSSQNDQSARQNLNMMLTGFQYMNSQPYNTKPMLPQMSAPDYKGYGHYYNDMPGMSCTPVDERCPSSCWTTNVYTGCLYCGCDGNVPRATSCGVNILQLLRFSRACKNVKALKTDGHAFKQQYQTTDSPVPTTVNQNIPFKEHVQTDHTDTQHSRNHQTQINTVVHISEPSTFGRLTTSVLPSNPTSGSPKLIFPTKPSKKVVVSGERIVSAGHPDGGIMTDSMSMNGNVFSLVFPTKMPTSLGLINISGTTFSYTVPTPPSPMNKTSPLISVLKSDRSSTKNKTIYSDHTNVHKTSQRKSKTIEQGHDSLTTPSRIIDDQRYFASIITEKNTEQNVQSTSLRKLEQPLKPLIKFRISASGNASSIPMHLSLTNTGRENHFLDNSTTGGRNYYGFYMHAESG